jgi:hypothetical protein
MREKPTLSVNEDFEVVTSNVPKRHGNLLFIISPREEGNV